MGFPLSSYTLLKELREKAPSVLRNFHLYAFVLHDPEIHAEFHQAMEDDFEMLDQITGNKVLFFTLLNPTDTWLNRAADRLYLDYYYYRKSYFSGNERLTAYAIAKEFGIPFHKLPCIVVTDSLTSRQFAWFTTDGDAISRQLGVLALAAESRTNDIVTLNFLIQKYRTRLEVLSRGHTGTLGETMDIVSSLVNVLAITNIGDEVTRKQVKDTLSKLVAKFHKLQSNSRYRNGPMFDSVCMRVASYLAQLEEGHSDAPLLRINPIYLDEESRIFSITADGVYRYFENRRKIITISALDHTPLAICLTKIFEHEVNLSVVQWIRKNLQVQLPKFYNKPDGFRKVPYMCGGLTIDFNKSYNRKLIYPGIGQSRNALEKMQQERNQRIVEQKFLREWQEIANYRNSCAHTTVINRTFVENLKVKLDWFIQEGFFEKLYHIKTAMESKGQYPT